MSPELLTEFTLDYMRRAPVITMTKPELAKAVVALDDKVEKDFPREDPDSAKRLKDAAKEAIDASRDRQVGDAEWEERLGEAWRDKLEAEREGLAVELVRFRKSKLYPDADPPPPPDPRVPLVADVFRDIGVKAEDADAAAEKLLRALGR